MQITPHPRGVQCLGAVRLLPIDVGYDILCTAQTVRLPDPSVYADGTAGVGYLQDDEPRTVTGTRDEVSGVLASAGYHVAELDQ